MCRERGESTDKQGEIRYVTGRKVRSDSIRAGGRMNQGGRPYISERPPFYIGAVGQTLITYIHKLS